MIPAEITAEALAYIMERGGVATVDFIAIGGCCFPFFVPVVTTGKPPDTGGCQELQLPPASIFLDDNALAERGGILITLTLTQALPRLDIKGVYHRSVREGRLT
ncbi:MAG: hypothetical protein K6U74_18435 [Firmicutes bacterium]|nr:hypothetical protein [Bacillota bacterium]